MLHAAKMPIEYIELGNETYGEKKRGKYFPKGGRSYADTVNEWVPELRRHFTKAKIGISLLARAIDGPNENWNREVIKNLDVNVDAYIYHIYVRQYKEGRGKNRKIARLADEQSVIDRMKDFRKNAWVNDPTKETWFTE